MSSQWFAMENQIYASVEEEETDTLIRSIPRHKLTIQRYYWCFILEQNQNWVYSLFVLGKFYSIYKYGKKEEFEDTKETIRIRKSNRSDNTMGNRKRTKGQTTIYKTNT
jgi:hypothetical protein